MSDMASMKADTAIPVDDLAARWERFGRASGDVVVETVARDYADEGETRRDVLTSFLAYQLGYSRRLSRRRTLETEPLWDLLDPQVYERVGAIGERALMGVIRSDSAMIRPKLAPKAALAAIAVWRNGHAEEHRREAERVLRTFAVPGDREWMFRLARRFVQLNDVRGLERPGFFQLAALQLGSHYWDVAAKLAAMYLARRYARPADRPDDGDLIEGCDRAAEEYADREGDWLQLMADAAMGGSLRFAWLERPVAAAMRLTVGDRDRYGRLQAYHHRRRYEVDYARLHELYDYLLEGSIEGSAELRLWARRRLIEEIDRTAAENPRRALKLAELVAIHEYPRRFGRFGHRIAHALDEIAAQPELDILAEYLVGLYVATYDIESYALRFVDRLADRVDWEANPVTDGARLELYLKVSDYDRAFEGLTFEIEGMTLQLGDKDAAMRLRYFVERRFEPTSVVRFMRRVLAPVEWMGATLQTLDPLEDAAERGIELFRGWSEGRDLSDHVVETYTEAGVPVETFADVAQLEADFVEEMADHVRRTRMAVGAGAGVVAGACGPMQTRLLSLSDIPVKLTLGLEACARMCWYYGFDPRKHPDLLAESLAVALEGPDFTFDDPVEMHRALGEFAIQTSFLVEAVGTRSLGRIAGRMVGGLVEQFVEGGAGEAMAATVERIARLQLDGRARGREPAPIRAALLGGAIDAAFVYDLCESAQAVLIDRFMARKYESWERRIVRRS